MSSPATSTRTVHPRSRGEHACRRPAYHCRSGSSPLARGTPAPPRLRRLQPRFIPARAGNTNGCSAALSTPAVHPRSRGEHLPRAVLDRTPSGSSPLARGTPQPCRRSWRRIRFIPARAGNTTAIVAVTSGVAVHPRSRGEHTATIPATPTVSGSSPLARGTPHAPADRRGMDRFIPARAGNTSFVLHDISASNGSSPLARGTRRTGASRSCCTTVHPRSRGEHGKIEFSSLVDSGSSPLARGTPGLHRGHRERGRFIPARAGNTRMRLFLLGWTAVHPRSRGEHYETSARLAVQIGSSPLARGTLFPELFDQPHFFRRQSAYQ